MLCWPSFHAAAALSCSYSSASCQMFESCLIWRAKVAQILAEASHIKHRNSNAIHNLHRPCSSSTGRVQQVRPRTAQQQGDFGTRQLDRALCKVHSTVSWC